MSSRRLILSPAWNDGWLAVLATSLVLAGLLWRLGDGWGTLVALGVSAVCVTAIVLTAAAGSLVRHLALVRADDALSSN